MQEGEPYVMTKKRIVRRIYYGRIIAAVVIVALLVMAGVLWFSRKSGVLKTESVQYNFVVMGEFAEQSDAQTYAHSVTMSGGAGYVLGGEVYSVAVACYAKQEDATTVCNRLVADGQTARVVTKQCPSICVVKPRSNIENLKIALSRPYMVFDELYSISVKADTKEISVAATQYALLKMSVACEKYAQDSLFIEGNTAAYLQTLFTDLASILDTAAQAEVNVLQTVKYAQCAAADIICRQTSDFVKN